MIDYLLHEVGCNITELEEN